MSCTYIDRPFGYNVLENTADTLPMPSITVLVVDAQALVRSMISQYLASQPEVERVITAQSYTEAEKQVAHLQPTIIWLDIHMGRSNSIEEIRRLRQLAPDAHIMALTDIEDEQEAFTATMLGVQGYYSKQDIDTGDIMDMIHMLCRGEFVIRSKLLTRLIQRLRNVALPLWESESMSSSCMLMRTTEHNRLTELTVREREVLQFISQGFRDRDIAAGMRITLQTVQKHVQSILSKLGVQNRTQAAYLLHNQMS